MFLAISWLGVGGGTDFTNQKLQVIILVCAISWSAEWVFRGHFISCSSKKIYMYIRKGFSWYFIYAVGKNSWIHESNWISVAAKENSWPVIRQVFSLLLCMRKYYRSLFTIFSRIYNVNMHICKWKCKYNAWHTHSANKIFRKKLIPYLYSNLQPPGSWSQYRTTGGQWIF